MRSIKKKELMVLLFKGFILSSLIVPTFFLNKIFFALILLFFLTEKNKIKMQTTAPMLIMLIFIIGFIHGLLNECDLPLARQFVLSTAMLFLIYPIESYNIDYKDILRKITPMYILATSIILFYGINELSYIKFPDFIISIAKVFDNDVINSWGSWLRESETISLGHRTVFNGSSIMIRYSSSPFVLVMLGIYIDDFFNNENKNKIYSLFIVGLLLFISIMTTGRALLLCEMVIVALAYLWKKRLSFKVPLVLAFGILVAIVIIYLLSETMVFSTKETSNSIKLGHIQGFFSNLTVKNFLFGDGLATYYYSPVYGGQLAHTEITLLDYIRYFGFFAGCAIYAFLVFPLKKINLKFLVSEFFCIVFFAYLAISLSNPVLFNSVGMNVILCYWSENIRCRGALGNMPLELKDDNQDKVYSRSE